MTNDPIVIITDAIRDNSRPTLGRGCVMDEIGARMLTNAITNAEQQLDRAVAAIQRHLGHLPSDLTAVSQWGNLSHDVAEGAYWAGQVRALRDAATLAGVA